jgi:Kef-type K+ transport system membrane component KefB/Trk K+ transport system NAD-binding subunit
MEHGTASVLSLMIVTGVAFFIPILLQKFKLYAIPVVVAEIIAGIIIGKSGFDIIDVNDTWLGLLSMLGLIFLMFLSGVEIDFNSYKTKKEKNSKKGNPFVIATVVFVSMLSLAYGMSLILMELGLIEDPFFMTIVLSTISLGIVVPVLKERKMIEGELGQTILLIAVLSDFVTMLIFAYYLAMKTGDTKIVLWIGLLLGVVVLLYLFLNRLKKANNNKISETLRKGTVQIGTRGVFALILFFVALSETLGVESILGAFLAGVIVSLLAPNKEFIHQLDSFGYGFLIPIFFVMVGVELDLSIIFTDKSILLLIPVVIVFLYLTRILPTLFLKKWFGLKESIGAGVLLASTMSLAIVASSVALEMGLISTGLNSAIVLVSIFSCFVSPIVYSKLAPQVVKENKIMNIIGSNRVSLQASLDFIKDGYEVSIYTSGQTKLSTDSQDDHDFPIKELVELNLEGLIAESVFEKGDLIIATSDDDLNIEIAEYAERKGNNRTIVKIENPQLNKVFTEKGFSVYSDVFAGRTLLKAMVHNPGLIRYISQTNESVREIKISSSKYDNVELRKLPFLGNVLILNVYRSGVSFMPHGDTKLKSGDSIMVSGTLESINKMKDEVN